MNMEFTKSVKNAIKRFLYAAGAMTLYHRLRNRDALTVATFHRVLPREDPRWNTALAEWTLSVDVFEDCLVFFKRHYAVVGLPDLLASIRGERPLPPRSLLLTFDDGYADNEEYALPLLRQHSLPAAVFVYSDAIGQKTRLWTEDFLWAYLSGDVAHDEVKRFDRRVGLNALRSIADPTALVWDIVQRGPQLNIGDVDAALAQLNKPLSRVSDPPQMLSAEQVQSLARHGVAIGAHGKTHTALCFATDLASELREPRHVLENVLQTETQHQIVGLSFPHGAHTPVIADRSLQEGYELLFTIQQELSPVSRGWLRTALIGRLNVSGPAVAPSGRLRPELLAYDFFFLPHAKPKSDTWGGVSDPNGRFERPTS
jgi:peptidoglycan/xylan/chitin deacetylase (PgdA/CDA1 family)